MGQGTHHDLPLVEAGDGASPAKPSCAGVYIHHSDQVVPSPRKEGVFFLYNLYLHVLAISAAVLVDDGYTGTVNSLPALPGSLSLRLVTR